MQFVPRAPQEPMIRHIQAHERCNVFASPGMGKTVSVLTALDNLSLVDDVFPALIIGPLRVADSVWGGEVEKWDHLKHLRISKILGTESQRIRGYHEPADIYCIHYGLLKWLSSYLSHQWPFKTVVADESPRLKSQRCSFQTSKTGKVFLRLAGSVNASALARHAPKTKRWINLTGTPAPKGLQDLWGQHWYIDYGRSLGKSYDAFTRRWFYQRRGTRAEQAVFEPFDHAQNEITRRIQPVTISLDAYDYFDCEKPREIDIEVNLPDAAMRSYRKLHKDAILKLSEETTITAVNAGVITNKCIAEGTPVLTDNGWKSIETVSSLDKVWDGISFVKHGGVSCNGLKRTVECFGVHMTPTHRVLTTKGWRTAEQVNEQSSERFNRAKVWLPHSHTAPRFKIQNKPVDGTSNKKSSYLAVEMHLWKNLDPIRMRLKKPSSREKEILWMSSRRNAAGSLEFSRYDSTPSVEIMGSYAFSLRKAARQGLEKLRRPWDQSLQAMERFFSSFLERYGCVLGTRIDIGSHRQQRPLRQEKLSMGNKHSTSKQQKKQSHDKDAERFYDSGSSSPTVWDQASNALPAIKSEMGCRKSSQTCLTYDITNAGPLRRYTVLDKNNEPLIVHNCLQLSSGNIYDEDRGSHHVHDAKLDALASLKEELNGAPLLVAYQFKPDRDRILEKFKDAQLLPTGAKQGAVEAQWNEGKIPMLVVHPASAGHGLNLQYGGCNLCIYSPSWDLELYQQIIERIGPVRQMQAGFDRIVTIYRLIAKGTFDRVVADRLSTKADIQNAVMEAVRL